MKKGLISLLLFWSLNLILIRSISAAEKYQPQQAAYSTLDFKVWVMYNAFQVQFIDPESKASAILFVNYRSGFGEIVSVELTTEPGAGPHSSVLIDSLDNLYNLQYALTKMHPGNVIAINVMGIRDFEFGPEKRTQRLPVFKSLTENDEIALSDTSDNNFIDLYRFMKLVDHILTPEKLSVMRKPKRDLPVLNICPGFLKD